MADTIFRTVLPALKAVDNGDGTYSIPISLAGGVSDMIPIADDTYWLGSDTKGWKGLKFPDLRLRQSDADTLSLENIAGTLYKSVDTLTYKVSGVKVVGAQGLAVADATDAPSVILRLNELLARCRAHGLIAT